MEVLFFKDVTGYVYCVHSSCGDGAIVGERVEAATCSGVSRCVFWPGPSRLLRAAACGRVGVWVLTALQVNKAQPPLSILLLPPDLDGHSAEAAVGDGAGACVGSYLLCDGRHHFHPPVFPTTLSLSLSLSPLSFRPSLWTRGRARSSGCCTCPVMLWGWAWTQ